MTSITSVRGAALTGAGLLSGCLVLCACSAGVHSSASSAGEIRGAPAAAAGPAQQQLSNEALNGSSRSGGVAATQTARLAPLSQSIIYTASLTLRSASATATAKRAVAIVSGAGGYTSAENATASSARSGGTVTLTLKVPVAVYQQVLADLAAPSLGRQLALSQHATDVTQQVADVSSLVSSQEAAISALRGLLRHAANVDQLLQVQQQISADESSLESLQAQQRALDHETSYATIDMTLLSTAHRVAAHKHHERTGFVTGLGSGWRALGHATTWLLTALGAVLPFLIIAAVLAGIGYAGRRRFSRRHTGPTATG
jgi:Domain of unknown function (DUF4349)